MTKIPTILLFPGAYHHWDAYAPFIQVLSSKGYSVDGQSLATLDDARKGLADDIAIMKTHLSRLIDQEGKDVVAVFHSYAGIPGGQAIEPRWSLTERCAKGEKGGIVGIIYIAAFIPRKGVNTVQMYEGVTITYTEADVRIEPEMMIELRKFANTSEQFATGLVTALPSEATHSMYEDVDPVAVPAIIAGLGKHSV